MLVGGLGCLGDLGVGILEGLGGLGDLEVGTLGGLGMLGEAWNALRGPGCLWAWEFRHLEDLGCLKCT
jgi:hypothetical protein